MSQAPLELGISDATLKKIVERPDAAARLSVLIDAAESDTSAGELRDKLVEVFSTPALLTALKGQKDLEPFIKKAILDIEAKGQGADGVSVWIAEGLMQKAAQKESTDEKVAEVKRVILRLQEVIVESLRTRISAILAAAETPEPEPEPAPKPTPANDVVPAISVIPSAAEGSPQTTPAPAPAAPEATDETAILRAFGEFLRALEQEVQKEPDTAEFGPKATGKGSQKANKKRDLARVAKRAESHFAANGNMTQTMVDKALKDKLIGRAVESITAKINERGMYEAKIQKAEVAQAIANAWRERPAAAPHVIPSEVTRGDRAEESDVTPPPAAEAPATAQELDAMRQIEEILGENFDPSADGAAVLAAINAQGRGWGTDQGTLDFLTGGQRARRLARAVVTPTADMSSRASAEGFEPAAPAPRPATPSPLTATPAPAPAPAPSAPRPATPVPRAAAPSPAPAPARHDVHPFGIPRVVEPAKTTFEDLTGFSRAFGFEFQRTLTGKNLEEATLLLEEAMRQYLATRPHINRGNVDRTFSRSVIGEIADILDVKPSIIKTILINVTPEAPATNVIPTADMSSRASDEGSAPVTPAPAPAPRPRQKTEPGLPAAPVPSAQPDDALFSPEVAATAETAERLAGLSAPVRAYLQKKDLFLLSQEPDCLQDLLTRGETTQARDRLDDLASEARALGLAADPTINLYRARVYGQLGLDEPAVIAIYTQALQNPDCDEETMNAVLEDLKAMGKDKADIANILLPIAAALEPLDPYKFQLNLAAAKVMDNNYVMWGQAGAIAEDQDNLAQAEICYGNAWSFAHTQKGKSDADTVAAKEAHRRVKALLS